MQDEYISHKLPALEDLAGSSEVNAEETLIVGYDRSPTNGLLNQLTYVQDDSVVRGKEPTEGFRIPNTTGVLHRRLGARSRGNSRWHRPFDAIQGAKDAQMPPRSPTNGKKD